MSGPQRFRQLVIVGDEVERRLDEARDRGYLSHVLVEMEDGELFAVMFYDPVRLAQDLEEYARLGTPYLAEAGLIVVPEITREAMEHAARAVCDEGFFEHLRPVRREELARAALHEWPPRRR